MELREAEIKQVSSALLTKQSLLVLGEAGCGKSHLGTKVGDCLEGEGFRVAIASYSGAAKETLAAIAEQLDVPTTTDDEKPKQMTAAQLRESLLKDLVIPKTLLICDDANRWSASLRYWLEDILRGGGLLLLLATDPPAKDIFVKLPMVTLSALNIDQIRLVMQREAMDQGMQLTPHRFAELQQRAGGNLALAKRVIYEELLGLNEGEAGDHQQYIDGTPFLIALIALVSIVRFVGLGLGDKSLYVMGGILTLFGMIARTFLYAANRRGRRL